MNADEHLKVQLALRRLYTHHWQDIHSLRDGHEELSAPLLMNPTEAYIRQHPRLLVVGQEGNGWCTVAVDNLDVEQAVSVLMIEYLKYNDGATYPGSPFWQAIRELEKLLGLPAGQMLWTNINKLAPAKGPPTPELAKAVLLQAPLLCSEILWVQPDVVIFFSGPNYDELLRRALVDIQLIAVDDQTNVNALCRLVHPVLPEHSFRTYHPQYLRQSKRWGNVFSFFARQFETLNTRPSCT